MESKKHKKIAEKLARKKGVEYHSDKGVDIRTTKQAIEIEVRLDALGHAKQQLAGSTKAPYIAMPKNSQLIKDALKILEGSRFGLMDENAKIYKRGRGRPA